MIERLIQIMADGIEELWQFPFKMDIDTIISFWKEYEKSDFDSFEDYMEEKYPNVECTRVFTEIIFV